MADLTPTQHRVALLVGAGASYKDIGRSLGMQDSTARVHVNTIAGKLPPDDLTPLRRVMIWVLCQQIHQRAS